MSKVVADTGELDQIARFRPVDATTNPTLVYKALQLPQYAHFLDHAIEAEGRDAPLSLISDRLAVSIGCEILKIIPGRVSTEVDARLSFDTKATVDKALRIIDMYAKEGHNPSRVYIKVRSLAWTGSWF